MGSRIFTAVQGPEDLDRLRMVYEAEPLLLGGAAEAVNPLDDLRENPDGCLERLIFGAKVQYLSADLLDALKSIALKAAADGCAATIRDLVDAWLRSPDSAINGVRDVADAVSHAYLHS